MKAIPILKTNIGRQPVQSKVGTGLNSNLQPYAVGVAVAVLPSPLARRPTGRK